MTEAASYHHGDLRAALLAAALDIVARDGLAALSLRALARAAGVSAMAPYHHFADRAALLAAVAAAGYDRLHAEKLARLGAAGDNPVERLVAAARGYVAFVIANPELYRLMGSPELAGRRDAALNASAAAPAASLTALIGPAGLADPPAAATQIWAFVHGLGQLVIDGHVPAAGALTLAETGTRALLTGLSSASAG